MPNIKLQPLGKRILVKPTQVEEKTSGGLVIPPTSGDEKRPETGEVVKLGIGKDEDGKAISFEIKVGDKVYFKQYSPEEVELEVGEYVGIPSDVGKLPSSFVGKLVTGMFVVKSKEVDGVGSKVTGVIDGEATAPSPRIKAIE